ncbi:MAG: GNAT family N-acetyltransferase [Bacteroidales bacterium]|nr:GNAT family N-acetyltransferase [Bacteroidales bacterium]
MERLITHNTDTKRFETIEDGITGYVEYENYEGGLDLTHTIVPKAIGGRGVAADLVKYVLDYAAQNSLKVKPTCSYVKVYIDRHKEQYGHLEDTIESKFPTIEGGIGSACGIKK